MKNVTFLGTLQWLVTIELVVVVIYSAHLAVTLLEAWIS